MIRNKPIVLVLVVLVALMAVPAAVVAEKPDKQPGIDFNGPHYNLNLVGKKADWKGGGSYDNPDRHTMFVPEDTGGWSFDISQPNNLPNNPGTMAGVRIWMNQGEEFAVLDGNAFDEDMDCDFQLAPGEYEVYIVARGKPMNKNGDPVSADITGWVQYYDIFGESWYYLDIGSVHVTKSKKWKDATDLFYVSDSEDLVGLVSGPGMGVWVFDYLNALNALEDLISGDPLYSDAAYFWQLENNGCKLIKVRFYPVS